MLVVDLLSMVVARCPWCFRPLQIHKESATIYIVSQTKNMVRKIDSSTMIISHVAGINGDDTCGTAQENGKPLLLLLLLLLLTI
jgi:hypothetical protein